MRLVRVGTGHRAPGAAIPVLDQGLVRGGIHIARVAHRPDVARGDGGHALQRVVVPTARRRVRSGDDAPTAPVPVFRQGAQAHCIGASVVVADRPDVAR